MKGDSVGEDEVYCEWFACTDCHTGRVSDSDFFCPNCGSKTGKEKYTVHKYQLDEIWNSCISEQQEYTTKQVETLIEKLAELHDKISKLNS